MSRKIATPAEIAAAAPVASEEQKPEHVPNFIPASVKKPEPTPENGVVFINNIVNREFTISPTKKHKFKDTREIFTDPELIKYFDRLAKEGTHKIFRVE